MIGRLALRLISGSTLARMSTAADDSRASAPAAIPDLTNGLRNNNNDDHWPYDSVAAGHGYTAHPLDT